MTLVRPIFHLSFPVRDLNEAVAFYTDVLGARTGRANRAFVDLQLFGAQITLHHAPDSLPPADRVRHFGATLSWASWTQFATRLSGCAEFVEAPRISFAGELHEQGKLMIADPSGNLIEIKAYRRPELVLGALAEAEA